MNQIENTVLRPKVIKVLQAAHFHVEITHMGLYMQGWPDLMIMHPKIPLMWIELKKDIYQKLRHSQLERFIKWSRHGQQIYVVHSQTQLPHLLIQKPNWLEWHLRTKT